MVKERKTVLNIQYLGEVANFTSVKSCNCKLHFSFNYYLTANFTFSSITIQSTLNLQTLSLLLIANHFNQTKAASKLYIYSIFQYTSHYTRLAKFVT